jgi:ribosomal protein S18 acetylase RimI-like enzyme
LIDWGRRQGATSAYLLVREGNAPARALYRSLGFGEVYRYANMVKG